VVERLSEEKHPVQQLLSSGPSKAPISVTMAAYEVYCHVYGAQEAMVTGGCRGGFSIGELIAFLYAKSFPKEEWSQKVDECFGGLENIR